MQEIGESLPGISLDEGFVDELVQVGLELCQPLLLGVILRRHVCSFCLPLAGLLQREPGGPGQGKGGTRSAASGRKWD